MDLRPLIDYINNTYGNIENLIQKVCELAGNDKITCEEEVYSFDKIKEATCRDGVKSCDALYIKKNINLIEFKTGFNTVDCNASDKLKKENMLLKIKGKASDSLHILEKLLLKKVFRDESQSPKMVMCAVIDSNESAIAEDCYVDILSERAGLAVSSNWKEKLSEVLSLYRKETKTGEKLFYDDTFVLYDYEFDDKFSTFK